MSVVKKGKDLLELWSGNKNYIHSICRTHFQIKMQLNLGGLILSIPLTENLLEKKMADIRKLVQRLDYGEMSNTVEGSTQKKVQLAVIYAKHS